MDLVKKLREERGWSQEQLAGVAEIGKRTIQRIEQGKGVPSPETAKALAQALEVTPGDLLRNSGLRARLRTLLQRWQLRPPTRDELAELPDDLRPGFTAFYDGLARLKGRRGRDETHRGPVASAA